MVYQNKIDGLNTDFIKNPNGVNHQENIIEAHNISFAYGKEEILKGITLNIHRGDYLGIVGSNGAGKTTFLKIILGLLKPTEGSVALFGKDGKEFKDWSKVGYVPQKIANFDAGFPATVQEVVMMSRYAKKGLFHRTNKEDERIVKEALEHVDMVDYKDRLIGDLSGGQGQRVFIAKALAGQPEIIFLDEPTTGVDIQSENEFYALLKKLNQELGLTLVLGTHNIERILKEAMHIACIDRTLVCHTSPEEFVKDNPSLHVFGRDVKIIEHRHNNGL